jgi:hypothetical protein
VLTRTRLVDTLEGSAGAGLTAAGCACFCVRPVEPKPERARPAILTRTDLFGSGKNEARAYLAWARALCAAIFCWDVLYGWPGRPENDEPRRFLEGRRKDVDLCSER